MKILLYTTHRTGSTSLAELLMTHYGYNYHRGSLLFPPPENIIIKITPAEFRYEVIKDYFDKVIVLVRENIREQAESRVYADLVEKKFVPYTIENQFLIDNKLKIDEMEQLIIRENNYLKECGDCLFLTYDELYNSSDGMIKMEEYLGTKFPFRVNNGKKYRDNRKSLI
jgi:hypothetical protein